MTNLRDRLPGEPQSDLLAMGFREWDDAWRTGLGLGSAAEPEQSAASFGDAMSSAPARACWIGLAAWLRYSAALTEAFVRYEASLMQAALDPASESRRTSPSESRVLVDETRAFLRRIGDAAVLEARRAQYELEQVGESIACTAATVEGAPIDRDQHIRRHEVKA